MFHHAHVNVCSMIKTVRMILYLLTDIAAFPESVNILDKVSNDVRTPDKLVDGCNETHDGRHAWLAPILPNQVRVVYIFKHQKF